MTKLQDKTDIQVATPYGVQHIVFDAHDALEGRVAEADTILIVIDTRVRDLEGIQSLVSRIEKVNPSVALLAIDINNYTKNTQLLLTVFDAMGAQNMTRKSLLISIGGGSTSDLVGVAAAMYMRGIDYVVIPTSFISMADTVISKVAVNHGATKNMIGAFRSPTMTFIDISLCATHDEIHIVHGLVEILKQALLEHDSYRVTQITSLLEEQSLALSDTSAGTLRELIQWSLEVKAKYITDDWYDMKGIHKALSLGHTLANYLEMKGEYHHAVAVAYGMLLEYILAYQSELISKSQYNDFLAIARLLEGYFGEFERIKQFLTPDELIPALQRDKISHFGAVRFVLPTAHSYVVSDISENQLTRALHYFHTLALQTA